MEDYDLRACFLPDLSGLHLRIYQFNRLLRQHVPKVSIHLDNLGVEGEYLSQWFLSLYAVTCPLPLLFRIYDIIFAEGASETIMRVALSIMKRNEKKILGYADFDDVMQLLLSRQLWDVYGLTPVSADEFVQDFVSFTSLVTRESLDALEASFREAQKNSGGRQSFLPSVSSAASRFLGRLWSSTPKQQGLAPGNVSTNGNSRPNSTLLRTPSKQSLSTIGSMEATSDFSTGTTSTASTAPTELSTLSRDMSMETGGLRTVKSIDSAPSLSRVQTQNNKEKELDGQIEDLLMMLSEMQKQQALLQSQLQKVQEDRTEDNVAIRAFIEQIKADIAEPSTKKASHRRVASEVGQLMKAASERPTISTTTVRLLHSLDQRLGSCHVRRSSSLETKADLRASLATAREQLHIETTRSQELARQIDSKDQESATLRDELQKARARIKDTHFDKQRLEKTVLELRHAQRKNSTSIAEEDQTFEVREADSSPSKPGGLREFRLGRNGPSRANNGTPTQIFSKRTSSLSYATITNANSPTTTASDALPISNTNNSPHHSLPVVPFSSLSAPPENDSLLIELANAKASEAVARQELEELRARFDTMRRMMTAVTVPASSPSPPVSQSPFSVPPRASAASPDGGASIGGGSVLSWSMSASGGSSTAAPQSASTTQTSSSSGSLSSGAFGFFGWGRK
jgi:Rab-GTPase-TBC domain